MSRAAGRAAPLFDSYVVVDWSAAGAPKRGRDSIWIAHLRRDAKGGRMRLKRLENPETRQAATARLADILTEELAAQRRVLAGFDFAFGYPAGSARKLGGAKDWSSVWRSIDAAVEDGPDNASNRFAAAARLNSGWPGAGPFWGNGLKAEIKGLGRKKPKAYGGKLPAERRLTELRAAAGGARPKPVWQLSGAGAVGGQTLTGLKALQRLREDPRLRGSIEIWPLETGLAAPKAAICLTEVYPSLIPAAPRDGEVKDAAQARGLAERFAALDAAGALRPLFSGPEDLTAEERRRVVAEEAWILGVGFEEALARPVGSIADLLRALEPTPARRGGGEPRLEPEKDGPTPRPALRLVRPDEPALRYERNPEAIYAESFDAVRRETRLDHLPDDMAGVAVRLVHACGMPEIADRLAFSDDLTARAVAALENGAPVLCDCDMTASGVIRKMLPRDNAVVCALRDPRVPGIATKIGNTRSAAAVELWRERIKGSVVAIGNAPTALFHLLELLDSGWPRPAAILGFPVGFVGAAESKALLAANPRGAAFLALRGRRGGSAMASAAVNALAALAMTRPRSKKNADGESG